MAKISLKRAYEAAQPSDGFRVLVDRLWPRGVTKEAAAVDLWLKSVAPSAELRKWFGHKPERWDEFRTRYRAELDQNRSDLDELTAKAARGHLTLVYGAKDTEHNQAVILKEVLEQRLKK
jgi:uncharacterized protein YeaO (DUF488 family)